MTDKLRVLAGPGGVRKVAARWLFCTELTLQSPAHFGGSRDDLADMMLLRDGRSDLPLLPGTSIAGALREYLQSRLAGYGYQHRDKAPDEDPRVAKLFGGAKGDDEGGQSPLIVFDSLAQPVHDDDSGVWTEIRDGIKIDGPSGVAAVHKKFDYEILPAGTSFPVRFELLIVDPADEAELVSMLVACLEGLRRDEITLGARRSRGFGRLKASEWRVHRFDLTTRDGWLTWLCTNPQNPFPEDSTERASRHKGLRAAVKQAFDGLQLLDVEDKRSRVLVEAVLQVAGPIMIGSPGSQVDDPDRTHLHSGGRPVLSATSLTGALRNRALRIARLVRGQRDDADEWVDRLFGNAPDDESGISDENQVKGTARSSRLIVSEGVIEKGTSYRPTRVNIDRFTQGVVKHKLFDEQPHHGGSVRISFELRDPHTGELGLLLLVLKDLFSGDLPLGGTASIGRGLVKGSGILRFHMKDYPHDSIPLLVERSVDLTLEKDMTPDELALLDDEIQRFANAEVLEVNDGGHLSG